MKKSKDIAQEEKEPKKYILERYQWVLIYVLPMLVAFFCTWIGNILGQILVFLAYGVFILSFRVKKIEDSQIMNYLRQEDRKFWGEVIFVVLISYNFFYILFFAYEWISHTRFMNEERYEIVYTIPTYYHSDTDRRRSPGGKTGGGSTYYVEVAFMNYYINDENHFEFVDLPSAYLDNIYALKVNKEYPDHVDLISIPREEIKENTAILMFHPKNIEQEFVYYPDKWGGNFTPVYKYNENGNYYYIENNIERLSQGIDEIIEVPKEGFETNPYTMLTGKKYVEKVYKHNRYRNELNEKYHDIAYTIPWFFGIHSEKRINIFAETPEEYEYLVDIGNFYYSLDGENYQTAYIELPPDYTDYLYALKVNKDYTKAADVIPIPLSEIEKSTAFIIDNLDGPDLEKILYTVSKEENFYFKPFYKHDSYGNYIDINEVYTLENLTKNVENLVVVPQEGFSANPYELLTGNAYKAKADGSSNAYLIFFTLFASLGIFALCVHRLVKGLK